MVTTTSAAPVELKSIIVWPSCFRLKNGQRIQRVIITGYGNNWNNPLWYLQTPVHFGYFVFTIICSEKTFEGQQQALLFEESNFSTTGYIFQGDLQCCASLHSQTIFQKFAKQVFFSVSKSALSPPHSLEIRKVF